MAWHRTTLTREADVTGVAYSDDQGHGFIIRTVCQPACPWANEHTHIEQVVPIAEVDAADLIRQLDERFNVVG